MGLHNVLAGNCHLFTASKGNSVSGGCYTNYIAHAELQTETYQPLLACIRSVHDVAYSLTPGARLHQRLCETGFFPRDLRRIGKEDPCRRGNSATAP
ncbi:hypothetical protein AVEN_63452-1 [Araneus ventricosus]|uniref:Uncharacterized protein n=1 Tax=Araneus ventricosus TaxID=182803 RepID=A0A4Y2CRK1_ARAVE|nr:hypothetical protein AVEN_63452-1 [Araneus ventricosus]